MNPNALIASTEEGLRSLVRTPYHVSGPGSLREFAADALRALRDYARLSPTVGEAHAGAYVRAFRATILRGTGFGTFSALLRDAYLSATE